MTGKSYVTRRRKFSDYRPPATLRQKEQITYVQLYIHVTGHRNNFIFNN